MAGGDGEAGTDRAELLRVALGAHAAEDLDPELHGILSMLFHTHGACSEIDCINSALQLGLDPRGSLITTMGILSKRIGTGLD